MKGYKKKREKSVCAETGNGLHLSSDAMEMILLAANAPDLCFTCPLSLCRNIYQREARVLELKMETFKM